MARGKVEPALCRPDVEDVRPPLSVRTIRSEVLRHEVRCDRTGVLAVRCPFAAPFLTCDQLVLEHETCGAKPPDLMAVNDAVMGHARAAIAAIRHRKSRPSMCQIDYVRFPTATSRVVSADEGIVLPGSQNTAHPADRKAGLLHFNEAECHPCQVLSNRCRLLTHFSLATKAAERRASGVLYRSMASHSWRSHSMSVC